ncbi:hypothetical protein ZOSMA_162G00060 [Zostera marina]|uniref:Aspergillus nuclease S1 n=1 Tax=Zostera marina TaxID=29655 RepID=A0A0K9PW49_ZOSMR|nr:hypothetical protein ZOSMA_162G00060 [Zostera marina]
MGVHCSFQILAVSLFLGSFVLTDGWGKEGHFMVCNIAEKYLSDDASAAVLDLLPASANGELASVCSWADQLRFRYRWSSPLHFIDTPEVCNYEYSRDCHNPQGNKDMCVAGAINNYTAQLQTYTDSQRTGCKHSKSLNSFCTNKLLRRLAIIVTIKVEG